MNLWLTRHRKQLEPRYALDPHATVWRKWFRRVLITVIMILFLLTTFWPVEVKKNKIASPITLVKEECVSIDIIGFTVPGTNLKSKRPLTWYDCTLTFSDGSWMHRVGDLKP